MLQENLGPSSSLEFDGVQILTFTYPLFLEV